MTESSIGKRRIPGVYKVESVWYIRYDLPRGLDGRRNEVKKACPGMNQKQAAAHRQELLRQVRMGTYVDDESVTVEALFSRYLVAARPTLAARTWERYCDYARLNIVPQFGRCFLTKLRAWDVQVWYNELLESGRADGKGGLSPKTVRNIHGLFHKALEDAVKWQMLAFNPLNKVEQPKVAHREMQTATVEQISMLREALAGTPYLLPFDMFLGTGLRRGELCGLQWDDIDFERGTMCIRRSIEQIGRNVRPKEPKNGRTRIVAVPPTLVERMRQENTASSGQQWVCLGIDGTMLKPRYLGHAWSRVMKKTGVHITLHQLRHTYATGLINHGVAGKTVQVLLGHSNMSTTMNIYAHVLQPSVDQAASVAESVFFGSCGQNAAKSEETEEI